MIEMDYITRERECIIPHRIEAVCLLLWRFHRSGLLSCCAAAEGVVGVERLAMEDFDEIRQFPLLTVPPKSATKTSNDLAVHHLSHFHLIFFLLSRHQVVNTEQMSNHPFHEQ